MRVASVAPIIPYPCTRMVDRPDSSDSPSMESGHNAPPRLLAVVEVDKADRVICQASGCGHSVYKRIHVVRDGGQTKVIGSECFKRLYGGMERVNQSPTFGSSEGRRLTEDERQALLENTERLVAQLEAEHIEAERIKEALRLEAECKEADRIRVGAFDTQPFSRGRSAFGRPSFRSVSVLDPLAGMSPDTLMKIRQEAQAIVLAQNPGANLDAPDWSVIVDAEIRNIVRRRRYGSNK